MKKLLLAAATLLAFGTASAQVSYNLGYCNVSTKSTFTETVGPISTSSSETYTSNGFQFSYMDNISLISDLKVNVGAGLYFDYDKDNDVIDKEFGLFVPVDLNYGFDLGSALRLSVYAGPTFEYGIMCKEVDADDSDNSYDWYDTENTLACNRFNIYAGGGIMIDFQNTLRLQAEYKWGLTNGIKKCDIPLTTVDAKTNILSVSIGYLF